MHRASCLRCRQISVPQWPRSLSRARASRPPFIWHISGFSLAHKLNGFPICQRAYVAESTASTVAPQGLDQVSPPDRPEPLRGNFLAEPDDDVLELDDQGYSIYGPVPRAPFRFVHPKATAELPLPETEQGISRRAYRRSATETVAVHSKPLGLDTLGRPAEAIVMRNILPPATAIDKKDLVQVDPSPAGAPSPISEDLATKHAVATFDEAHSNIEELCPRYASSLPRREFKALANILYEGFTVPQLQYYVSSRLNRPASSDGLLEKLQEPASDGAIAEPSSSAPPSALPLSPSPFTATSLATPTASRYAWILTQTPWTPLQEYDLPQGSPKEKLVQMILQDCWNLRVQEMLDGRGKLVVQAGARILKLLLRGTKPMLHELAEQLLDDGDRVEISKQNRTITILSTKAKAETVLDNVDKIVHQVRMRTVDATTVGTGRLLPEELEALGQITNTAISYDPSQNKLRIAWIQRTPIMEHLETPDRVVIRLMAAAVCQNFPTTRGLVMLEGEKHQSETDSGHFASDPRIGQNQVPGWRDSLAQWSRWVLPSSRVADSDTAARKSRPSPKPRRKNIDRGLPTLRSRVLPNLLQPSDSSFGALLHSPPPGWQRPQAVTTAYFGHILHSTRSADLLPAPPVLLSRDYPRILAPLVPPPSAFSSWGLSLSSVPVHTTIAFRFRVSPVHAAAAIATPATFPVIELVLTLEDGQSQSAKLGWGDCEKRLFAIMSTHDADVLMPMEQVDVRLTQNVQLECSSEMLHSPVMEKLGLFVDMSDLNLQQGRLVTPPEVVIPIPPSLIIPHGPSATLNAEPGAWASLGTEAAEGGGQPVTYTFDGLGLRQCITTKCAGHTLQYTSIEAGHHGGRRVNLSLRAADESEITEPYSPALMARRYLGAVQSVANGEHFPWFQAVSS